MPKQLIIDGKAIEVEDGITLIQACEQAGVEIPRFCYHERLSIAGNCRMRLVEVQGMPKPAASRAMGAIGRGEDMEITTYLERGMMSELSANVTDLCPVGALTHRPWAFIYRPWELRKTESIDVMDAVGSAIRVDARGREVLRILPRNNDAVNEEWISDKTRFVADGLRTQRLDRAYIRRNSRLEPASWDESLAAVAGKLKGAKPERIGAIAGDLAGAEEMF